MKTQPKQNQDIAALIARYPQLNAQDRFKLGDELYAMGEAALPALWQAVGKSALRRFALSTLARMARRFAPDPQRLNEITGLLADHDVKVRKHAAVLLGAMGEAAAPALCAALGREDQAFVRASILLSLGQAGGAQALDAVQAHQLRDGDEQEREARRLALDKLMPKKTHTLPFELPVQTEVAIATVLGCERLLSEELKRMGVYAQVGSDHRIRAQVKTLAFAAIRTVTLWLLPGARVPSEDPAAVAADLHRSGLPQRIRVLHGDLTGEFRCRVQVNLPVKDRAAWIRAFSAQLGALDSGFVDSPSAYELQWIITPAQGGCRVDARLHTHTDHRFDYRKQDVPASINPATAAGLLMLAKAHLSSKANIIDPFCGSGTLLVERARLMPCQSLTGVDLSVRAIAAARENLAAAELTARIVRGDARNFSLKNPADELMANLPFGNRVGNHTENEQLYRAFIGNLPNLLKPGGLLLLYTMEQKLMRALLKDMDVINEVCVPSGGLKPVLFIARRRK